MAGLAAKQVGRQASLQPLLALPAGRGVTAAEGLRLAGLGNGGAGRPVCVDGVGLSRRLGRVEAVSAAALGEGVARRVLQLRQRQSKGANGGAAAAHAARRERVPGAPRAVGGAASAVAGRVWRREGSAGARARQHRRARAGGRRGRG